MDDQDITFVRLDALFFPITFGRFRQFFVGIRQQIRIVVEPIQQVVVFIRLVVAGFITEQLLHADIFRSNSPFVAEDFINHFEEEFETTIKQQLKETSSFNIQESECITNMTMTPEAEQTGFNFNFAPDSSSIRDSAIIRMDGELVLSPFENCDKIIIRKGNQKPKTIYI